MTTADMEYVTQAWVLNLIEYIQSYDKDNAIYSSIRDTPRRVARMWAEELLVGYLQDPKQILKVQFVAEKYDEIVLVRDIEFFSICEHHLLPFYGVAHVGYIPRGKVVGVSKLARLVDCFARRLQLQERLTEQIASTLMETLQPEAVGVVLEAKHLCMVLRGVRKQNAVMSTSALLGAFRDDPKARAEFFALIKKGG